MIGNGLFDGAISAGLVTEHAHRSAGRLDAATDDGLGRFTYARLPQGV
jgi:hypothetical protein